MNAAEVPRESAPCNATNEAIIIVESFIGDVLTEVQNGLGYADARAKSNRIFFNAWLSGQTNGYSYGELVDIANNAIWQYRDMHLRPDFYANNLEKIRVIIAPVIEDSIRNEVPSFNVQVADKLPLEKAMQSHCF